MKAVCVRCGAAKGAWDRICPACGQVPEGDGLLVAWLLGDAHLTEPELERAALRIRAGEAVRPSARMLDAARRALGIHAEHDTGLTQAQRLGLLALGFLVSPAPGLAMWWSWRGRYPRSALQALGLSLPTSILVTLGFCAMWIMDQAR